MTTREQELEQALREAQAILSDVKLFWGTLVDVTEVYGRIAALGIQPAQKEVPAA